MEALLLREEGVREFFDKWIAREASSKFEVRSTELGARSAEPGPRTSDPETRIPNPGSQDPNTGSRRNGGARVKRRRIARPVWGRRVRQTRRNRAWAGQKSLKLSVLGRFGPLRAANSEGRPTRRL